MKKAKRPESSIQMRGDNIQKEEHPGTDFFKLENSHKIHLAEVEQYNKQIKEKQNVNNNKSINTNFLGEGAFHKVYKAGENTAVSELYAEEYSAKELNKFNNAFIPALLSVCGEQTISFGINNNKQKYCDLAKGDLFDVFEEIEKEKQMEQEKKVIVTSYDDMCIKAFAYMSFGLNTQILKSPPMKQLKSFFNHGINKYFKITHDDVIHEYLSEFLSRKLFKIFLFQMHDRKLENMLVLNKQTEDGSSIVIESDFDDVEYISCIFGNVPIALKKEKRTNNISEYSYVKKCWAKRLKFLVKMYKNIKTINFDVYKKVSAKCKQMVEQYTMNDKKIQLLIEKAVINAQYLKMSDKEIKERLYEKIKQWKEMLNDNQIGEIVEQLDFIKEARKRTLDVLNNIDEKYINDEVEKAINLHIKMRNYKNDKDRPYDKFGEEKIMQLINQNQKNIIKKQKIEKAVLNLNGFINNGTKLQRKYVKPEYIVEYLKQEKDKSRSFWWCFGKRNKRFNALCEALEQLGGIKRKLFTDKTKENEDIEYIKNIFSKKKDTNINNNRANLNLQKIYNRLDQVTCCSCG